MLWSFIRNRFDADRRYGLHLTASLLIVVFVYYVFLELAELWMELPLVVRIDERVRAWIARLSSPVITSSMKAITSLGGYVAISIVGILVAFGLWMQRRVRDLLAWAVVLPGGMALTFFLKTLIQRARPTEPFILAHGFSFPSGHAVAAVLAYGFLGVLIWTWPAARSWRGIAAVGLILVIVSIGFSRLYFNVHYPTDVLAGYAVGIAWITATRLAFHVPGA